VSVFKDEVTSDISSVFLNPDDFAEERMIDGKLVACILASDQTIPITGGYRIAITDAQQELYVRSADVPHKKAGGKMMIGTVAYDIDSWQEDMGIAHIRLSRAVGT